MANKLSQTATARAERLAANLAKGITVSPEDIELLERYNWRVDECGYAMSRIGSKFIRLHVLVFERMTGSKPAMGGGKNRQAVRHIVNVPLDCRRENINTLASTQANLSDMNVSLSRRNTSGISGVSWQKRRKQWKVVLNFNHHGIFLGRYDDLDLATLVANTCREARSWAISLEITLTQNEIQEYIQHVARAVVATKATVDYRSLLIINSLTRTDERPAFTNLGDQHVIEL